jgi:hypothetical protein
MVKPRKFQQRQLVLAERSKRKQQNRPNHEKRKSIHTLIKFLLRLAIYYWYVLFVFVDWLLIEKPWDCIDAFKKKLKMITNNDDKNNNCEKLKEEKKGSISKLIYAKINVLALMNMALSKLYHSKDFLTLKLRWLIRKMYELWRDTELILFKIRDLPFSLLHTVKSFLEDSITERDLDDVYSTNAGFDTPEPVTPVPQRQSSTKFSPAEPYGEECSAIFDIDTRPCFRCSRLRSMIPRSSVSFDEDGSFRHLKFEDSMKMDTLLIPKGPSLSREDLIDDFFNTYDALEDRSRSRKSSLGFDSLR